jgi:hypothetical protein
MQMATSNSPWLKNHKGHINKEIVVKQYDTQTVVTSYPDRSRVTYSEKQKVSQARLAEAIDWARSIIRDPRKKAEYSKLLPKGKRLYNAAIQEYLNPQDPPFSNIKPPVKKRGRINKENCVIKNYNGKAVLSRIPASSNSTRTEKQTLARDRFSQAVAYAQAIIADPVKKAAYQKKLPKRKKAYHAALKEFLKSAF